jgi:hypothetical protein
MKNLQATLWVCLACLILIASCKPSIEITSANEPSKDAEALALVVITMTPVPKVAYMNFQAGMDDHMDLVIRFPKSRIEEFWKGAKWAKKDAKVLTEQSPRMREIYQRRITQIAPGLKNPDLELLRKSTDGIWCDEPAGSSGGGLKVFLSVDQDSNEFIVLLSGSRPETSKAQQAHVEQRLARSEFL